MPPRDAEKDLTHNGRAPPLDRDGGEEEGGAASLRVGGAAQPPQFMVMGGGTRYRTLCGHAPEPSKKAVRCGTENENHGQEGCRTTPELVLGSPLRDSRHASAAEPPD